jgi:glycosyltransferase involved in cell wall biosynthesis
MWLPQVSIILPAFNCERYIAESVSSILQQVYDNFELLVIDDGSTDNTFNILSSITDQRLRVLRNDGNKGLIYSLNRGIDESKGEYIARMDADDIAVNDRIEKQVHWLLHHPRTAAVGCFTRNIDAAGNELPDWDLDRKCHSADAIRQVMPRENCIAHPSMMMRAAVLKQYRYARSQKNIEDYDLWLRMLADGLVIEKLPQPLLLYRVHETSVTNTFLRKKNPFLKNYQCKKRFLADRIKQGRWGWFESRVGAMMLRDRLMAIAKTTKQQFK